MMFVVGDAAMTMRMMFVGGDIQTSLTIIGDIECILEKNILDIECIFRKCIRYPKTSSKEKAFDIQRKENVPESVMNVL